MNSSVRLLKVSAFVFALSLFSGCTLISGNDGLEKLDHPFNAEASGFFERTVSGSDFSYDSEMLIRIRNDDDFEEPQKSLELHFLAIKDNRQQDDGVLFEVMSFRLYMDEGLPKEGFYEIGDENGQAWSSIIYLERARDSLSATNTEFRADMRSSSGSLEIRKSGNDYLRGRFEIHADLLRAYTTTEDENTGQGNTEEAEPANEAVILTGEFEIDGNPDS